MVQVLKKKSPDESKTACAVYDRDSDSTQIYGEGGDQPVWHVQKIYGKVDSLQWLSDNTTVLYLAKANAKSPVHLFSTNLVNNLTRDLTPFAFRNASAFYINERGTQAFALLNIEDKASYQLYKISTADDLPYKRIGQPPRAHARANSLCSTGRGHRTGQSVALAVTVGQSHRQDVRGFASFLPGR